MTGPVAALKKSSQRVRLRMQVKKTRNSGWARKTTRTTFELIVSSDSERDPAAKTIPSARREDAQFPGLVFLI